MKGYWILAIWLLGFGWAQDLVPVKLQLKWFPQAQFAGYLVAQQKGFYAQEGLEVTLLPTGDQSPVQTVMAGAADFGTTWMADLLTAREKGLPVVHLAQIFQDSGFALVALKSSGITDPCQIAGKKVGVWPAGNEYPVLALLARCGLSSSLDRQASQPQVQIVTYPFDPALVFPKQVDLVSAMTYNELDQILGLGYSAEELTVFRLSELGILLPEDLIFSSERVLQNPNFKKSGLSGAEVATRLIRASLKGWDYAVAHQEETVREYVLPFCGNTCKGSGTRANALAHQTWQMAEVAKLYQAGRPGWLDPADYQAAVQLLRAQGILKQEPAAAVIDYGPWQAASGTGVTP